MSPCNRICTTADDAKGSAVVGAAFELRNDSVGSRSFRTFATCHCALLTLTLSASDQSTCMLIFMPSGGI